jgi:hypothetical protein
MSKTMHRNKINTTMLIAAFTDHNAVQLHLQDQQKQPLRGPSTWKLNTNLLHTEEAQDRFYEQWDIWKQKKSWYRDISHWWEICVKPGIRRLFRTLGRERAQEYKQQENLYYSCLYDLLKNLQTIRH